jgi:predicted extracellular nuclease
MFLIRNISILTILTLTITCSCLNKTATGKYKNNADKRGEFRIMFYNVENLFDIYDDSLKQDNDFLPEGNKHWHYGRFTDKLNKLYKVIIAVGGWEPPEVIGLCEIENNYILDKLINDTPLSKFEYGIVHRDSPDTRGIDVALLFRKDKVILLQKNFHSIAFPWDSHKKTRDILYFKGLAGRKDTLHIFVNHWPSRRGGQLRTESYRVYVASLLKNKVDSIFSTNKKSKIIITGDFNDGPENKSIAQTLSARINMDSIQSDRLYNLSYNLQDNKRSGTSKYKSSWEMYDQFMVSGALISTLELRTSTKDIHIFRADFLFEEDDIYSGLRPYRTYRGYTYTGGFSDHLPVYLDLN